MTGLSETEMRRAVKNGVLDALGESYKIILGFLLFDLVALIAKRSSYAVSITPQYASIKERLKRDLPRPEPIGKGQRLEIG